VRAAFSAAAQASDAPAAWQDAGGEVCSAQANPALIFVDGPDDPHIEKLQKEGVPLIHRRDHNALLQPAFKKCNIVRSSLPLQVPWTAVYVTAPEPTAAQQVGEKAPEPTQQPQQQQEEEEQQRVPAARRVQATVADGQLAGTKRPAVATPVEKRRRAAPTEFLSQADDEDLESESEVEMEEAPQRVQAAGAATRKLAVPSTPVTTATTPVTPVHRTAETKKALEALNRISARRERIRSHMAKTTVASAPASAKARLDKKMARAARLKALASK